MVLRQILTVIAHNNHSHNNNNQPAQQMYQVIVALILQTQHVLFLSQLNQIPTIHVLQERTL
jgi:hypothetical protein